ncbi:MAG: DNA topoisomerase IV subunit A [Chlamydiales bacterium]|nr:DNA topoisomerase IV subunit A [Chlamydiales bacterium]
MDDLKDQMQDNFLKYASYVILDRAIPNVVDGLKPVQRRILHTLYGMDDGKLHKVANVAGQTMAYHPHGDAPITEALVNLANKGFLLDRQGNFGNLFTGDPAAASRYIETRLSLLAKETLFNKDLTETLPSYDGRHQEPVAFPAKIPVLLMQGAEGIAVGMATRILPHNFSELLQAEIDHLEGKEFTLLPDFPTGGIMDASSYDRGLGKIKLRARLHCPDEKTIVIKEVCYGTTTESLIQSIDESAKKGKIKIDSIYDFTAENVEIEIKLPRGQYAHQVIDALYAFTECEVSLSSQVLVIKDNFPWQTDVHEILKLHVELLQEYLKRELEFEKARLLEKIFHKSLERIFIENRIYKRIEEIANYQEIHATIASHLLPFHEELSRIPSHDDREKLLNIPIRRISRFDLNQNKEEIERFEKELAKVEKDLKQIKRVTISYLKGLLTKYGKDFERKTEVQTLEEVDKKAIASKKLKIFIDPETGFAGTKVQGGLSFECTNFDKLLFIFKDGSYVVINIPEKHYLYHNNSELVFAGVADKKTVFTALYLDPKTKYLYGKRFIIEKFILDKVYRFIDEDTLFKGITQANNANLKINFKPKANQKVHLLNFKIEDILVKGVSAKGIRISDKEIKTFSLDTPINLECL